MSRSTRTCLYFLSMLHQKIFPAFVALYKKSALYNMVLEEINFKLISY